MRTLAVMFGGSILAGKTQALSQDPVELDIRVPPITLTADEYAFAQNNKCVWRTIRGKRVCIMPKGSPEERKAKALASYVPATAERQQLGHQKAQQIAKMLDGEHTGDMLPMDVITKIRGKAHAVEVKTLTVQKNDKLTMHPESRRRKEGYSRKYKATLHTVAVDARSGRLYSGHQVYYRRGVGSFRLTQMVPVKNAAHLRQLMTEEVK